MQLKSLVAEGGLQRVWPWFHDADRLCYTSFADAHGELLEDSLNLCIVNERNLCFIPDLIDAYVLVALVKNQ